METPLKATAKSAKECEHLENGIIADEEDEDATSIASPVGNRSDKQQPEGNDEPPSLKSIARELKRAAIDRLGYSESDDEDDFDVSPTKTSAISTDDKEEVVAVAGGQQIIRNRRASKTPEELLKCQEEFRRELFKTLKEYFKAAFTIIVKRRRLCPSSGFHTVRVLGVKVPRFLHPSSLEYVEEVSKKLLTFLNRNTTEGCAIHIMIEKNKTLHVVQRFVFKTFGAIDALGSIKKDSENKCCIEDLKNHCRASLVQISTSDRIKPVALPQFSRWSISIGLKKEFVSMDMKAFKELWDLDPSGSYFPWKERLKSLASTGVSVKIDLSNAGLDISKYVKSATPKNEGSTSSDTDHGRTKTSENGDISRKEPRTVRENPDRLFQTDDDQTSTNMGSGIVCFPVSSFPICEGLMLCLYGLQYPTPMKNVSSSHSTSASVNNSSASPFIIRTHRGPRSSMTYRLSQIRSGRSSKPA